MLLSVVPKLLEHLLDYFANLSVIFLVIYNELCKSFILCRVQKD
jgi:hypothetical protein